MKVKPPQVLPPDPGGLPSQAGAATVPSAEQLLASARLASQHQQQAQLQRLGGGAGGSQRPGAPLRTEGPTGSQHAGPSSQRPQTQRQPAQDVAAARERQRVQQQRRRAAEEYARAASQPPASQPVGLPGQQPAERSGGRQRSGRQPSGSQQPAGGYLQTQGAPPDASAQPQRAPATQNTGHRQAPAAAPMGPAPGAGGPPGPAPRPVFADAAGVMPPLQQQQSRRGPGERHLTVESSAGGRIDDEDMMLDGLDGLDDF